MKFEMDDNDWTAIAIIIIVIAVLMTALKSCQIERDYDYKIRQTNAPTLG